MRAVVIPISHKYPRISAWFLGLFFTIASVVFVELFLRGVHFKSNKTRDVFPSGTMFLPDTFPYHQAREGKHRHIRIDVKTDKEVFDATYSIDSFGRRITPVQNEAAKNKFLLFLGCSMTFGPGLRDDETLPFYTAKLMMDYQPYNNAQGGDGPYDILALLENHDWAHAIPEKNGVILYVFYDGHVRRLMGSFSTPWNYSWPYYQLNAEGSLVRHGTFRTAMPLRYKLYDWLQKSPLVHLAGFNFPFQIKEKDIIMTARTIEAMRDQVRHLWPEGRFYVAFYPASMYAKALEPLLKERQIDLLDYSFLFKPYEDGYCIKGDGHPSAYANQVLAKAIAQDLAKGR